MVRQNVVVSGNIFNGKAGSYPYAHYGVYSSSSDAFVRAVISGNTFRNVAAADIALAGGLAHAALLIMSAPVRLQAKKPTAIFMTTILPASPPSPAAANCNIHDNY